MTVDRKGHDEMKILTCPLPECGHSWCKFCQQPASLSSSAISKVPHSCDGTNKNDNLMGKKGRKRHAGKTPELLQIESLSLVGVMCTNFVLQDLGRQQRK